MKFFLEVAAKYFADPHFHWLNSQTEMDLIQYNYRYVLLPAIKQESIAVLMNEHLSTTSARNHKNSSCFFLLINEDHI